MAIASHLDQGLGHVPQGQQSLLGLALLQIPQQAVEKDNHQDCYGVFREGLLVEINASRDDCHDQQHDQHHVAELVPEDLQGTAACLELKTVGAKVGQAARDLSCAQPILIGAELLEASLHRECVPSTCTV